MLENNTEAAGYWPRVQPIAVPCIATLKLVQSHVAAVDNGYLFSSTKLPSIVFDATIM